MTTPTTTAGAVLEEARNWAHRQVRRHRGMRVYTWPGEPAVLELLELAGRHPEALAAALHDLLADLARRDTHLDRLAGFALCRAVWVLLSDPGAIEGRTASAGDDPPARELVVVGPARTSPGRQATAGVSQPVAHGPSGASGARPPSRGRRRAAAVLASVPDSEQALETIRELVEQGVPEQGVPGHASPPGESMHELLTALVDRLDAESRRLLLDYEQASNHQAALWAEDRFRLGYAMGSGLIADLLTDANR